MVQIFVTGGTFDKEYNYITGELYFKDSHLKDMLVRGRCTIDFDVKTLMMIDSLKMTDADRQIIAYSCAQCASDKIIITHGTDTMVKTASVLAAEKIYKTIVITDKKATLRHEPFHKADIKITSADISKAHRLLDWQPTIDLPTGLSHCVRWHNDNQPLSAETLLS